MGGHGVCKVEAVGDSTESGRLLAAAQKEPDAKTPLTAQLDRLGALITKASYAIAVIIVIGRLAAYAIDPTGLNFWAYLAQSIMLALTLCLGKKTQYINKVSVSFRVLKKKDKLYNIRSGC